MASSQKLPWMKRIGKMQPIISSIELTQRLELAKRDSETIIRTIFHTFRMLHRNMGDIKKTQNELLEKKTTKLEIEHSLDVINNRLDSEKEKY